MRNVGASGIISDIPSVLLPASAWSDGRNVKFDNDNVSKRLGYAEEFSVSTEPQLVQYWPRPITPYYITANGNTVQRMDASGVTTSLVPDGTTFNANARWRSGLYNGGYTVIMNNGVDAPHYITYGTEGQPDQIDLQPLPDWPSTLSAQVVVGHQYAMIAGNLTDRSGAFVSYQPGTVRISAQAAPGGVPASWTIGEELLTTADEFELANSGVIHEIISLRGRAIVFTDNSIHAITLPAPGRPTRVDDLNDTNGVLATGCAVEFDGKILVVDRNDVYVTSGTGSIKSVIDHKMRTYFFNNLNTTHYEATFVVRNPAEDEIWICYPTVSQTEAKCNEALVWNYRTNVWTIYDLPNSRSGTLGPRIVNNAFAGGAEYLMMTGYPSSSQRTVSNSIHRMDVTNQFNGENFPAYVERKVLDMQDSTMAKWIAEVYPLMEGTGSVDITMQGTANAGEVVDLSGNARGVKRQTFNIETGYKVDNRVNGRYLNLRVSSNSNDNWIFAGYTFDYSPSNKR